MQRGESLSDATRSGNNDCLGDYGGPGLLDTLFSAPPSGCLDKFQGVAGRLGGQRCSGRM